MTWINRVDGTTLEVSVLDRNALEVCSKVGRATGVWLEGRTDGQDCHGGVAEGLDVRKGSQQLMTWLKTRECRNDRLIIWEIWEGIGSNGQLGFRLGISKDG